MNQLTETAPRPPRLPAALAVAALAALAAGCPTEVASTPEQVASRAIPEGDAPRFAPATDAPPEASEPSKASEPAEPATSPPAAPPADGRLPWGEGETTPPPPEAEALFADAAKNVPAGKPEEPAANDKEPAKADSGDFGDFLDDAYAGLVPSKLADDPKPTPETPEQPAAAADAEAAAPADAADLWGAPSPGPTGPIDSPKPAATLPELTANEAEQAMASLPKAPPADPPPTELPPAEGAPPAEALADGTPKAKPPTTTDPADADQLADLWGDLEAQPEEPEEEAPPAEPEPLPEPLRTPEVEVAVEPPAPDPIVPVPPAPETRSAPAPPPAGARARASAAIAALPAVPVTRSNTRHLAWLLGSKLSLVELGDLDGANPASVEAWTREAEQLAKELKLPRPAPSQGASDSPAQRIQRLMETAARLGDALAREHGTDHAALLEISLKTNALLAVARDRPDLAAPVAAAVRGAADRALLPSFLWEETVQSLQSEPTSDEAIDVVVRLHQRVEPFLR